MKRHPRSDFILTHGPYGTYDMGGDVMEWNEANINGVARGMRGGAYDLYTSYMAVGYRNDSNYYPTNEWSYVGFRVAASAPVTEPGSFALLLAGAGAFLIWRLRRKA